MRQDPPISVNAGEPHENPPPAPKGMDPRLSVLLASSAALWVGIVTGDWPRAVTVFSELIVLFTPRPNS